MRKDINFQFTINGVQLNAPRNWQELEFLATYDNDSIQPNISTNELILVNEAYNYIMQLFNSGKVFEGIPVRLSYSNSDVNNLTAFEGYIDLSDGFSFDVSKPEASVKIVKDNGLNSLNDRLSALDYKYLANNGVYSDADYTTLNYVVEKPFNFIELAVSSLTVYLLSKTIYDEVKDIQDKIATGTSLVPTGIGGGVASTIYAILTIAIRLAYYALILVLIIKLARELFDYLVPPKRETKTIKTRLLLEKVANYLGYGFETGITDLDNYYYIPSNANYDDVDNITGAFKRLKGTSEGIPSIRDNGYDCLSMFNNLKNLFNAKFQVIEGVLQFRNEDDPYWENTSVFVKKNPLKRAEGINSDELVSNKLLSYATDLTDDWTIDNYEGTSFQIHTKLKNKTDQTTDLIKGFEEVSIPFALGNRKNELNALENALKGLFKTIDSVANLFGGRSNLANKLTGKIGFLKVSTNNWANQKIVYLLNNKLPTNHRDKISMRYIYNTYYQNSSFVLNNFRGQEYKITGEEIPMNLKDFDNILLNGYFKDVNGDTLKAKQIVYKPYNNKATIDYNWKQPYTTNLIESYYEPK